MKEAFNKEEEMRLMEISINFRRIVVIVNVFVITANILIMYFVGGLDGLLTVLVPVLYVMLPLAAYFAVLLMLYHFRESSKVISKTYSIFRFPLSFFRNFIFVLFKQHIWPYLMPILIYLGVLIALFVVLFLLFTVFKADIGTYFLLIIYLAITAYSILISHVANLIFKYYFRTSKLIKFREGKNDKEKMQNHYLYKMGFNNNEKAHNIAMRYFHQDNVKVLIYILYFIIILSASIINLGGFLEGVSYVENMFQALLSSLGTYICFERIMKNKSLFNLNGKILLPQK